MRKRAIFGLLILTVLTGCRHNISSNPKVLFAATILDASIAVDDFSIALRAANDGVEQLQFSEPGYYAKIHPYLVNLAKLNDKAIAALRAAKNGDTAADWKSALSAIATEASKMDPTVFGFKNPESQASVKILFASFTTAINAINKSFGGK